MHDDDPTVGKAIWKQLSTRAREDWPNTKRDLIKSEIDHQLLEAGVPWYGSVKASVYCTLAIALFMIFCIVAL